MSATFITLPANRQSVGPPPGLAALPVDLSHSPLLGILGVLLGAGIVTITGRLLSLGLADLKGNVGIGFDDGAWIGSAFNIALMFIGPFTVYLGGLLGARRVLILAAASFTLLCVFLPFIHNYRLLISALVLAGLSSGTFYPLTLTFAPLDQGQRLDWWRSGLFNALFFGALIFLLASLIRRLRSPNPLVDLPYLRPWNTQLLAVGLIFFRFSLLATIILIPQSLAIHG